LKVVFRLRLSQKEVSSEFSSTLFNFLSPSNLDIFNFPFLLPIDGRMEENVRLLVNFRGDLFSELMSSLLTLLLLLVFD